MPRANFIAMPLPTSRITQRGLGTDEGDEVEQIDAWWNPPPTPPMTCPSTLPPASHVTSVRRRLDRQTISLEGSDE